MLSVLLILSYAAAYTIFFALLRKTKKMRSNRLFDSRGWAEFPVLLAGLHLGGILLFGIIPLCFHHTSPLIFISREQLGGTSSVLTLLLVILLPVFGARMAGKEMQPGQWGFIPFNHLFLVIYFLLRIGFILAYECWFRGFLLQDSIAAFGLLPAILLNTLLYALLHLVNDRKEVWGCIPFGLLLCSLCLWQGGVWPAVLIHLTLTLSYEISFLGKVKAAKQLQHESMYNRSLGIPGK
jgi:membrane protease YdiL (CAAX protease family)